MVREVQREYTYCPRGVWCPGEIWSGEFKGVLPKRSMMSRGNMVWGVQGGIAQEEYDVQGKYGLGSSRGYCPRGVWCPGEIWSGEFKGVLPKRSMMSRGNMVWGVQGGIAQEEYDVQGKYGLGSSRGYCPRGVWCPGEIWSGEFKGVLPKWPVRPVYACCTSSKQSNKLRECAVVREELTNSHWSSLSVYGVSLLMPASACNRGHGEDVVKKTDKKLAVLVDRMEDDGVVL